MERVRGLFSWRTRLAGKSGMDAVGEIVLHFVVNHRPGTHTQLLYVLRATEENDRTTRQSDPN